MSVPDHGDGASPDGASGREPTRPAPAPRPAVRFAVAPASRIWIAACLGLGGAFLGAAALRSLGALLVSFEHPALEALLLP